GGAEQVGCAEVLAAAGGGDASVDSDIDGIAQACTNPHPHQMKGPVMGKPDILRDGPVYLDYNATTPVDPAVVEAMNPYLTRWFGNPSSTHPYGRAARDAVQSARGQVADLVGGKPDEIVFTGSGSEANTLATRGPVRAT